MDTDPPHSMAVNVANAITVLRILAAPMMIWLVLGNLWIYTLILFCLAGASDAVDGHIARRYGQRTELGAILDPFADKVLLVTTFILLTSAGLVPLWLVILLVTRDVLIVGAVVISRLVERPVVIAPLIVSKLTTVAQILFAVLIMAERALVLDLEGIRQAGILVVAGFTLASAIAYGRQWMVHIAAPHAENATAPHGVNTIHALPSSARFGDDKDHAP